MLLRAIFLHNHGVLPGISILLRWQFSVPDTTTLQHVFGNGLVLLGEPMPWLRSAAFALVLPAGCRYEAPDRLGLAGLVNEMVQRGAGNYSSRELVAAQDNIGLERSSSISTSHTSFGGSMPAESLAQAISLHADIVLRPHLPSDQLEDARLLCLQELQATQDDLPQLLMNRLKLMHYGDVLGRNALGTSESIAQTSHEDVRRFFEQHYQAQGAILAVAGNFDWSSLKDHVGEQFGDWKPRPLDDEQRPSGSVGYDHIEHQSQQTHLGIAFPAVSYSDPEYYCMRAAVGVLSDGMSSRLFTEVRENRGLCYTINAGCHSLREGGGVFCYAGTTAQRAQETLDVTLEQLRAIADGIEDSELERLKVRIQSSLIMEQESSASRASAIVSDWYLLGRVRALSELQRTIDSLTTEQVVQHWRKHGPTELRIVTIGPEALSVPQEIELLPS